MHGPLHRRDAQACTRHADVCRRDLLRLPGSEFITLAEHQRLLGAIASHDADEAERAMLDHLTRANERYRILEDAMVRRASE